MKHAAATALVLAGLACAFPPNAPTRYSAAIKARFDATPVAPYEESAQPPYDRRYFKLYHKVKGECNTREWVLIRDAESIEINEQTCRAESGTWISPYEGRTIEIANDPNKISDRVTIEHMVPLSHAWKTGAFNWTSEKLEDFGNDHKGLELWTVSHEINKKKGNQPPQKWMPPAPEFQCTYLLAWIEVKSASGLWMSQEEKDFIAERVEECR